MKLSNTLVITAIAALTLGPAGCDNKKKAEEKKAETKKEEKKAEAKKEEKK
ncbi:MAG: TlpA family protein disulfide reductase, partial [Deltaproteobacteria bacterium]